MRDNVRNGVLTAFVAALVALTVQALQPTPGPASQGNAYLPTTGQFSGLQAANYINDGMDALLTCNKGSTAPTNALGGVPKAGQCWLDDTSATLLIKKRYSGSAWVVEGVIDVTNGVWVPPVGGGMGSVASASTTNLCASPQAVQTVTGSTSIGSFGADCPTGAKKTLVMSNALTLGYNATSMILPGQIDYVTAAGDVIEAIALGGGSWRVTSITKINGNAVANPAVEVGSILWSSRADAPAKYVFAYGQALDRTSYPDYLAAVTRTQAATRSSGNPTLTSVADTSSFGVGMPIEGTGISPGTTILSVTSSTITMSANAATSGTSNATVFLTGYGASGSSSTVGVMDCRGRVLAGRGDMGGTDAARLNSAAAVNSAQGSKEHTLTIAQMPAHDHGGNTGAGTAHSHGMSAGFGSIVIDGGSTVSSVQRLGSGSAGVTNTESAHTHPIPSQGSSSAHPIVQPTLIAQCLVRVLAMQWPANDKLSLGAHRIDPVRRTA